jgi:hypothetical protein
MSARLVHFDSNFRHKFCEEGFTVKQSRQSKKRNWFLWVLLSMVLFALMSGGCGGGGGNDGSSYIPPPPGDTPAADPDDVVADPSFLSDLAFDSFAAFSDETPCNVVVRVMVDPKEGLGAVKLYQTDAQGNMQNFVAELLDNGDVQNGDDINEDGVYSGRIDLMSPAKAIGNYYFRAFLDDSTNRGSTVVWFRVIKKVSWEEHESAQDVINDALNSAVPSFTGALSQEQFDTYRNNILLELNGRLEVAEATYAEGDTGIFVKFVSGASFFLTYTPEEGFLGGGGARSQIATKNFMTPELNIPAKMVSNSNIRLNQVVDSSLNSNLLLGLFPFHTESGNYSLRDGVFNELKQSTTPKFKIPSNGEKVDDAVLVSDFKTLSQFGVVMIDTHGGVIDGQGYLAAQKLTPSLYSEYQKDLEAKWLVEGTCGNKNDRYLSVGPQFIKKYNVKGLSNGIVYLGACKSLKNDSLADAFLSIGFAAVLGFNNTVATSHAYNSAGIFGKMIGGKSFKDAYWGIIFDHPIDYMPPIGYGAVLKYKLRQDVEDLYLMPTKTLMNSNFEDGLAWWIREGDVRTIASLTSQILPPEGKLMCIISTGLGSVNASNSTIEQIFMVPENATKLTYKYNFVSEEPMEYVNSAFNDQFEVKVINYQSEEFALVGQGNIDDSTWYPLNGDVFPDGDKTAFHTGWITMTHNIADESKGKPVRLTFHIWDKGDSLYDSALLIDDIKIE